MWVKIKEFFGWIKNHLWVVYTFVAVTVLGGLTAFIRNWLTNKAGEKALKDSEKSKLEVVKEEAKSEVKKDLANIISNKATEDKQEAAEIVNDIKELDTKEVDSLKKNEATDVDAIADFFNKKQ